MPLNCEFERNHKPSQLHASVGPALVCSKHHSDIAPLWSLPVVAGFHVALGAVNVPRAATTRMASLGEKADVSRIHMNIFDVLSMFLDYYVSEL